MRFGDFIRKIRVNDSRELRQADVAEELGISLSLYTDIENNRRKPFDFEKMEIFIKLFNLPEDKKTRMYDLASYEKHEIPVDLEDIFMYDEVGDMARVALREFKAGNLEEEDWKQLIRKAEENKSRRKGGAEH
jgi:transcriptional regulator with XRE-family HTH domain